MSNQLFIPPHQNPTCRKSSAHTLGSHVHVIGRAHFAKSTQDHCESGAVSVQNLLFVLSGHGYHPQSVTPMVWPNKARLLNWDIEVCLPQIMGGERAISAQSLPFVLDSYGYHPPKVRAGCFILVDVDMIPQLGLHFIATPSQSTTGRNWQAAGPAALTRKRKSIRGSHHLPLYDRIHID